MKLDKHVQTFTVTLETPAWSPINWTPETLKAHLDGKLGDTAVTEVELDHEVDTFTVCDPTWSTP